MVAELAVAPKASPGFSRSYTRYIRLSSAVRKFMSAFSWPNQASLSRNVPSW